MDNNPTKMRDPTTASSRIYVGNLNNTNDSSTTTNIQQHFSRYGNIKGILINRSFGFIQFDNEQSAAMAIQSENNAIFQNRKIIVRTAVKSQIFQTNPNEVVIGQDLNRTAQPARPIRGNMRPGGPIGAPAGQINDSVNPINVNINSTIDNIRDRSPLGDKAPEQKTDSWNNSREKLKTNTNMDMNQTNYQQMPPVPQQRPQLSSYMQPHQSQSRYFERNDCEIIVVSKALTDYAEAVEARLKRLGLLVDLLFPNEDVPISVVLTNITSRGCLFAILVTPEHAETRSITINVLFGIPSEHRNVPVNDGIDMIYKTFLDKVRDNRALPKAVEITPTTSYAAPPLNVRHPQAIQTLINLLNENRPLTVLQYDRVIRYLQERRGLQLKAEVGDAPNIPVPPPIDPEAELHKKIMDILNKPSITTTATAPAPSQSTSSTLPDVSKLIGTTSTQMTTDTIVNSQPLLNDPKVQKALDSLLQGNLFNF